MFLAIYAPMSGTLTHVIASHHKGGENLHHHPGFMFPSIIGAGADEYL